MRPVVLVVLAFIRLAGTVKVRVLQVNPPWCRPWRSAHRAAGDQYFQRLADSRGR